MKKTSDVIVIGGGIIGASCAWRLAQQGLQVTVLERTAPGSQASQAALGVLTFHADPEKSAAMNDLALRNGALYPAMIEELSEITGEHVDFHTGGQLAVALMEADVIEIEQTFIENSIREIAVERPTPEECRLLEPNITPKIRDAVFFPKDAWVDNTALTLMIVQAAERAGVVFEHANVQSIMRQADRVTGVKCKKGSCQGDWVILAAGCWSGQIRGVPPLPVEPVRGQALSVAGRAVRRVVYSPRGYLVPKGIGQTMIGATVEYAGFDTTNTLSGLREIMNAGYEISPQIGASEFLGAWAGLRPATPDHQPFIGCFDGIQNLVAATGHFRNGILLAPVTARLVEAIILEKESPMDVSPFRPDRIMNP